MDHIRELHRLTCEARFWDKWARKNGREAWEETKARIAEKRGDNGLNRLLGEMNRKK